MLTMSAVNWLFGMLLRISLPRVTDAVSVDLTSTVGVWAMTVTSSDMVVALSSMSTARVVVVDSRIFSRLTVPKPVSTALTWYSPGGRAGKRNSPLASVRKVRVPMRFTPVSVIPTPGSGAPWSSLTVPLMAPVSRDWENATGARRSMMAKMDRNLFLKYGSFRFV